MDTRDKIAERGIFKSAVVKGISTVSDPNEALRIRFHRDASMSRCGLSFQQATYQEL